jgi:hypothetical protein
MPTGILPFSERKLFIESMRYKLLNLRHIDNMPNVRFRILFESDNIPTLMLTLRRRKLFPMHVINQLPSLRTINGSKQ